MANVVKETREVGEFNKINMKGVGGLVLAQGSKQEMTVEADEYQLARIRTDVINSELVIDVGRDWVEKLSAGLDYLSTREVTFYITVEELEVLEIAGGCKLESTKFSADDLDIKISGASSVNFGNLKADALKISMPGACKVELKGSADKLDVNLTGAGSFLGADFKVDSAKVNLIGVGSATVWATDELEVGISGVGTVSYYGNPSIKQSIAMMGTVKSLGKHK